MKAHSRTRTSGQGVEEEDLLGVGEGAVDGLEVGDDVLDEEGADGDDAGERVQLAPEEGVAFAGAERLHAAELAAWQEVLAVRRWPWRTP